MVVLPLPEEPTNAYVFPGSIDKSTNKPQTKGIRCEVAPIKLGGSLPVAGTKIEVGGPLRVDYDKEKEKTYVSVRVAELKID